MPGRREIGYIEPFAESGDHLRVCISTVGGRVIAFTVQYETLVGDRWFPVVRYGSNMGRRIVTPWIDKVSSSESSGSTGP